MEEKKILTAEQIKQILEDDYDESNPFKSMDELIAAIKSNPNAKHELNRFFKENLNVIFKTAAERFDYLKKNFVIEGCGETEPAEEASEENNEASPEPENETSVEYVSDFDKIAYEMENVGYSSIVHEQEEKLSSETVILVEGGVIENGCLKITWRGAEKLDMSKVLIMEKKGNRVFALGHLLNVENSENKFWCVFDNSDTIRHDLFEGNNQVRLVIYTSDGTPHCCVSEMDYRKMEIETEKPLCIDFGTSNTTAGSYGIRTANDIEVAKFVDVTAEPHNTNACMLPTVVYVEDCSDPKNIKYLFGYEALKKIELEKHYEFMASAFFEIKRWMTSPSTLEEIRDNDNNRVTLARKEIVKAYIDYVIDCAEKYFGKRFEKIHFSAPVKLKSLFISTFKELYCGEKIVVEEENSIDEAFAIVYNQIVNIIEHSNENISQRSVLIIDCGGGTTDMASCTFSYTKNSNLATDDLNYTSRFENGNPNFGGNNITYMVMQLLKIKIASKFDENITKDAINLINKTEDEILNAVEKSGNKGAYNSDDCENDIYRDFIKEYEKCESIIPTRFAEEDNSYDFKCKKRNFYCMWRLAEKIKIEFFNTIKVQFDFSDKEVRALLVDSSNDYFYVNQNNYLVRRESPLENITITNKDVERVICGNIYGLLYSIMKDGSLINELNNKMGVEDFDYYKLSGQSCKIPMFKELLKEYIPGRKLRPYSGGKTEPDNNAEHLKLECLHGCIKYIKDKRGHRLSITSDIKKPKIIYNVYIQNERGQGDIIFDCNNVDPDKTIFKSFGYSAAEMFFDIKNKEGEIEKSFPISLDDKCKYERCNIEKLLNLIMDNRYYSDSGYMEKVLKKLSESLEGINDRVKTLFCVPSLDNYGIIIFLMEYDGHGCYKLLGHVNEPFEDPDKTFFDGKR